MSPAWIRPPPARPSSPSTHAGANSIAVAEGANFEIDPADVTSAIAGIQPVAVIGTARGPRRRHQCRLPGRATRPARAQRLPGRRGRGHRARTGGHRRRQRDRSRAVDRRLSDDDDPAALARALAAKTHRGCVVTLGEQGLVAHIDGHTYVQPALPTTVVDTTGAGDAFCGVFTAALAEGHQVETALRWGQAAGALAAAKAGAQPSMPMADDIRRLAETELA